MGEEGREAEPHRDARGDDPVVADDEVPPEHAEGTGRISRSDLRRRQRRDTLAAKQPHEHGRHEREEREDPEDREILAGPAHARALAAPEDAEARQQEADRELDRVLRDPLERRRARAARRPRRPAPPPRRPPRRAGACPARPRT